MSIFINALSAVLQIAGYLAAVYALLFGGAWLWGKVRDYVDKNGYGP